MGYRLRQTLVGTRKRKAPTFLVFQSLKDAGLNGFSEVTTLSSALLETYLAAATLVGTRQNRGRTAIWQGLFATWCLPAIYKSGQMANQNT